MKVLILILKRNNTIEFELQNFAKTFAKLEKSSEMVYSGNYKIGDLEFCLGAQSKQSDDDDAYYLNLNLVCESARSSKYTFSITFFSKNPRTNSFETSYTR